MASCLPILRPLFKTWSLESIVWSVRSTISLRSLGSGGKSAFIVNKSTERSESETAITGVSYTGKSANDMNSIDVEAFAMGKVSGEKDQFQSIGSDEIWRETETRQSSEQVV